MCWRYYIILSDFKDVFLAIEIQNKYKSVAGLKLKISKTEALYFAKAFEPVRKIHEIKCSIEGETKCLCIYIGHNMKAWNKKSG